MIELILFVALGFLVAAMLGLIVAPAIYRRVVKLTERRMRSTVPLNAAEIKAAKDMERAAFAAQSARISVELRKEREMLTEEKVGSSRLSSTIVKMRSQNEQLRTHVDDLKLESGQLRSNLRVEEGKLEKTQATLKAAQDNNLEKEKQITSLIDRANRLSTDVGALKIDLASKDTESENLRSTIDALRSEHKKIRNHQTEIEGRAQKLQIELGQEQERANELDKKLNTTTIKLANREQTLEQKSSEIKRIKERMNSVKSESTELKRSLRASETDRRALERRLLKVEKQLTQFTGAPTPVPVRKPNVSTAKQADVKTNNKTDTAPLSTTTIKRALSASEIADRVEKLRGRHNALVEDLNKNSSPADDGNYRRELSEIAAMMIDLTAAREGETSLIHTILGDHKISLSGTNAKPSLADRSVRRLEKTNTPPA